jgi:hypothetical protein
MAGVVSHGGAGGTASDVGGTPGFSGAGGIGGASGGAKNGGAGGAAGQPSPAPGFTCHTIGQCQIGQSCVQCSNSAQGPATYLCAPNSDTDPDAYAAATANCPNLVLYGSCDGPEDCNPGEYCIFTNVRHFQCSADPAPAPLDCGIYNLPEHPSCTLCDTDADCPSGQYCWGGVIIGAASGCRSNPAPQ